MFDNNNTDTSESGESSSAVDVQSDVRLIIAGGRDYILDENGYAFLEKLLPVAMVISGGCRGVDLCGEAWAAMHGIPVQRFTPNWDRYGKRAGPVRNREMAEVATDLAVFPGGAGTKNMIEEAVKSNLRIHVYAQQ
jgi:hypothetical protein